MGSAKKESEMPSYHIVANGNSGTLELDFNGDVITGTVFGDPIKGFQGPGGSVTFVRSGGTQTYQGWFQKVSDLAEYDGYFIDVNSGTPAQHVFAWRAERPDIG